MQERQHVSKLPGTDVQGCCLAGSSCSPWAAGGRGGQGGDQRRQVLPRRCTHQGQRLGASTGAPLYAKRSLNPSVKRKPKHLLWAGEAAAPRRERPRPWDRKLPGGKLQFVLFCFVLYVNRNTEHATRPRLPKQGALNALRALCPLVACGACRPGSLRGPGRTEPTSSLSSPPLPGVNGAHRDLLCQVGPG